MGSTADSITQYGIYSYQSNIVTSQGESDNYYGLKLRANPIIKTLIINSVANDEPLAADVTPLPLYARAGAGKERFGITARRVNIKRLVGTTPLQFYIHRSVPWLQNTLQETLDTTFPISIAYQGQNDWIYVSTSEETTGDG